MEQQVYRDLLPLVNDRELYSRFMDFVTARIDHLRGSLESASDIDEVRRVQGAIRELRRMQKLKEEAIERSKK
jgi:hypothetical protein